MVMTDTIYTIGYSGFLVEDFISLLKLHNISLVVDVRSMPFSNRYPEYNENRLKYQLKRDNIYYRNYAKEFGARQRDYKYYTEDGYLDFEKFSKSDAFDEGVQKLCESMKRDYKIALMCAEKDPLCCHRCILVARAFFEKGYNVIHLLTNGKTETQEEINLRLLEKYYPNRNQLTLFESMIDDKELLNMAYRKQNAEIGYRLEE